MRIVVLIFAVAISLSPKNLLDPDFRFKTEEGRKIFSEELAIALAKTPGASPETRQRFKAEAEKLIAELFLKGQKIHDLPHEKVWIYWDQLSLDGIAIASNRPHEYSIHLNEIMFFSSRADHTEMVIPHEVAHLVYRQFWGTSLDDHGEGFEWILKRLAPNYRYDYIDIEPGCRLLSRLPEADKPPKVTPDPCENNGPGK